MTPSEDAPLEKLTGSVDDFLRAEGLEVVDAIWSRDYPVLYVHRVVGPPLEPCGFCAHAQAIHEDNAGPCLAFDCACEVYSPPLTPWAEVIDD